MRAVAPLKCLFVYRGQKLDGNQDLLAGMCGLKHYDWLEIISHGNAAAVEVDDLRNRPVGAGVHLKPDARAGEVVSVEGFWYFDPTAKPNRFWGKIRLFLHLGPS